MYSEVRGNFEQWSKVQAYKMIMQLLIRHLYSVHYIYLNLHF